MSYLYIYFGKEMLLRRKLQSWMRFTTKSLKNGCSSVKKCNQNDTLINDIQNRVKVLTKTKKKLKDKIVYLKKELTVQR